MDTFSTLHTARYDQGEPMDTTGIRFVDELKLKGKTDFIRCDFNVPLDDEGTITDDARILAAIPTIQIAIDQGAKVILASHLGRPKGEAKPGLSLAPVGNRLSELLDREVILPNDIMDDHVDKLLEDLKPEKQVMLLENLRFHPGEKKNDPDFAARLASFADVYINDAFGTAHRAHASTYGMVRHFDQKPKIKAGGLLIRTELEQLGSLLTRPDRPFIAVMGGAKVSDKLEVLHSLIDRVQGILIGGAMAYTFLKAQGYGVGKSLVEEDLLDDARDILTKASNRNVKIHLPQDHVVVSKFEDESGEATEGINIPDGKLGFDIGPKTRGAYASVLAKAATVFWNGPMGVFEREAFAQGTFAVAQAIANSNARSVVGGGDSASAVRAAGLLDAITHVSTGGGASLEFVEGRTLPGIEGLRSNHPFDLD